MKRFFLISSMGFFSLVNQSVGQTFDGQLLLDSCTARAGTAAGYCVGVLRGYNEGLDVGAMAVLRQLAAAGILDEPTTEAEYQKLLSFGKIAYGICIPEGATDGQLVRVLTHFLEGNPQRLHEYGEALIYSALNDAFPCEENL